MHPVSHHISLSSRLALTLILIALCFLGRSAAGQELVAGDDPESIFQEACGHYREADYYRALIGFRKMLRDYPEHTRISASLLMEAKCYYWLQNYSQAIESLETLMQQFEHSTYLDNAHYLLGNCYFRQGHSWRAAEQFRQVIQDTDVPTLGDLARDCLHVLITSELSTPQLMRLFESLPDDRLSPSILLQIARRELSSGNGEEAVAAAEQVLQLFPESEAVAEAEEMKAAALEMPQQAMTIGVLCPLTGAYSSYGDELRNGARLAMEEYNTRTGAKFELQVRDTASDPVKTVQAARSLVEEPGTLAIIGPLLSTTAVGAGAISDCHGVPLISPTAAEGEIAAIGKYVFQRSVAARVLSKRIAAYATDVLGLQLLAVVAPRDDFGATAADGFIQEATQRGAKLLTVVWYSPGATDFKDPLIKIRLHKQAYDDSLMALEELPVDPIPQELDSLPPEERRVSIDGIFIPAYPEEAGMIAPQIAYHRIDTRILGTRSLGSPEALRIGGHYLEGAVFATDFSETFSSEEYERFVTDYRFRHGKNPGKVAVFSYECTNLVLRGAESGVKGREGMYHFLTRTEKFPGLTGYISFNGSDGANYEAMILTVQGGQIAKVDEAQDGHR